MANEMRDRLVELLKDTLHEWECDVQPETVLQIAEHLIENDVVPVVRCKDCKHYKKINYDDISQNTCGITTKRQRPYDYCNYGEMGK